jgi:23S rRNA (uracil1939-C5)-methyltransferase
MTTHPPTSSRPSRGDQLELTIDSLAFGGAGVARLEGYVVFVSDAVPGDRVRAVVGKSKRAYAEARAVEILEPSPERIPAVADHPGAPWQVLPYERQLEVKQEQVAEALRRIGKLEGFELEPIVPALEQWRYRNKLEYSFGADDSGRLVCGFHAPGRWDQIIEVRDCLLASEAGNAARERIVEWCRAQGLAPYDRRSGEGLLRNLVVREGRRTGQLQARLITSPGQLDGEGLAAAAQPLTGLLWTQIDSVAETTTGGSTQLLAEHRDGRAALRSGDRERTARRVRARLRPVLRDRNDRAADRAAGGRAVGPGDRPRGDRRRDRKRTAQRDRQRPLLRR